MTVEELSVYVQEILDKIQELFKSKNANYRSARDALANFYEAEEVKRGYVTPIQYAKILMSKQDSQVTKAIWEKEIDPEFEERVLDGIVYRIILTVLYKNQKFPG